MLFKNKDITLRHLQEKDKELLVKWLTNPFVLQYYEGRDNPHHLDQVEGKFYRRKDEATRCIVEYKGVAIGYAQYYKVNPETSHITDYFEKENVYGMDQFIGETNHWNKGIGTKLVKSMITFLMTEKHANAIIMDPQMTNDRAIRCYEKCGFKKIRILPKHEFHEGIYRDCWLMEFTVRKDG
ncbi:GNAT family N-acetyltransferase [Pseudogracilibacillus auburnensis]|uniref:Aminoglycoside 6'-N-acetyltransferase n=1 Tax=Pseudogracilibacillus auburnensis TaxID=1494959 RepID=A0A2V3VLB2_9BACI|nr:GNAT family N-acetyltransferase [Pseudogracilibacillus auburnensis]MBO1002556.1 GNAT family N-acetyltransferase [Pseudogracilibacillus auburnensis]PXW82602.1 aminoglycoside 6'-N-acetyltransferase [Pseudogracilibacillus auburnensis]